MVSPLPFLCHFLSARTHARILTLLTHLSSAFFFFFIVFFLPSRRVALLHSSRPSACRPRRRGASTGISVAQPRRRDVRREPGGGALPHAQRGGGVRVADQARRRR